MGQLTQQVIFFNDAVGNIEPGSSHTFFEAGTTTPLAVFSDKELTTPIVQPVLANSRGILPQIWLQPKSYRWIGEDANLEQIFDRDDVNFAENVVNTSSSFVFSTVNNMVLGILINGESIDLQDGQSASTQGSVSPKDGLGEDYIVEAVDPGGSIALNNGRFATELENFESSDDVTAAISVHNSNASAHPLAINAKITTHDSLSLGAVHTTLMTGHNADSLSHPDIRTEINDDITAHNTASGTHNDIRTKITNDISSHNGSNLAHSDIRNLIDNNTDKADKALGAMAFMTCRITTSSETQDVFHETPGGPTFDTPTFSPIDGSFTLNFSFSFILLSVVATPVTVSSIRADLGATDYTLPISSLDFVQTDSSGGPSDGQSFIQIGFALPTPP